MELPGERPVARSDLHHPEGAWLPEPAVQIDDRASEQLGEHRMHVRAGDEVTVGSDGRPLEEASGTGEREVHVLGERDRAVVPDRGRDGVARIHGREGTGSWIASVPVSAEIRLAASMIGVRDASDGPEVLVIERTLDHRFLPGYVAFPGGAVDPEDAVLAERWFGRPTEASRAAAIRELAEEVGLAVVRDAVVAEDRDRPLAPIHDAPPPAERLQEVARWIAPIEVPVRFDARYYAVRMDGAAEPTPDGAEAARAWWASPRSLLSAWESEEVLFYWPTHFTMGALAECRDADEVLGLQIVTREPDEAESGNLPRSVFFQD
jgi:8-oxo-dGTP pyrophosphatase MutT (NUDIX family)